MAVAAATLGHHGEVRGDRGTLWACGIGTALTHCGLGQGLVSELPPQRLAWLPPPQAGARWAPTSAWAEGLYAPLPLVSQAWHSQERPWRGTMSPHGGTCWQSAWGCRCRHQELQQQSWRNTKVLLWVPAPCTGS